jgi:hypothetical protein
MVEKKEMPKMLDLESRLDSLTKWQYLNAVTFLLVAVDTILILLGR